MSGPIYENNILLLGMVYAHQAMEPKRGQEFRDRVRCEALEKNGFNIYTLDDKHDDSTIDEHCRANFADTRRMMQAIKTKWTGINFQHVILDYFFSPVGWARQRWNAKFFSKTLPTLASEKMILPGGKIWLPNLDCIQEQLDDNKSLLAPYFDIKLVKECDSNPLYFATDNVEKELLRCPDTLTNETQIRPLLDFSDHPFYVLQVKGPQLITTESTIGANVVTPIPDRAKNVARKKISTVRGRKHPKRGYVSDNSESEPSTPSKKIKSNPQKK